MYRGVWVGTEVAVKHVKNTKHQVSSDSHGNGSTNSQHIVQIMAVSYLEKLHLPGLGTYQGAKFRGIAIQ